MLAKKCKGVTDNAPCVALCDLCHKSCDLCDPPSVVDQPPTYAPIQPVESTTLDEHGFSAEQLKQKQAAMSFNALPCEKDQQLFLQTGKYNKVDFYYRNRLLKRNLGARH